MSGRWHIYKNGESLGPLTAEEIRSALREGTVDPFDLVAREGSTLRRELVEVDEIFQSNDVVYNDAPSAAAGDGLTPAGADAASEGFSVDAAGRTQATRPGENLVLGQGHMQLAADQRITRQASPGQVRDVRRRKDPKRFQAMDGRGRIFGPMSAGEIQSLFYKGILDKDVKIMRDGSKVQVPVARFVALYSEAKGQKAPQQGAHPSMSFGKPQQPFMRRAVLVQANKSWFSLTTVVIIAALAFSAAAFWIVHAHVGFDHLLHRDQEPEPASQPQVYRQHIQRMPVSKALPTPAPRAMSQPLPRPTPHAEDVQKQKQRLAELRRRHAEAAKQKKVKATPKPLVKAAAPKPAAQFNKPQAAASVPAPIAPPAPAPAAPKPASGGALNDGQQLSHYGPMTFDKSALDGCSGACNIIMNGPSGAVHVAFFKAAFGTQLQGKSGGVFINGTVRKNDAGVKVLLSGVQ